MTLEMFDTDVCQLHGTLHDLTVYSHDYQNNNDDATYLFYYLSLLFIWFLVVFF